jgi:hypothetical protein
MLNPKCIIIHHSATPDDDQADDWDAIRKYHMSWRYKDVTITADEGRRLLTEGKNVLRPWRDIGYHWGVESVKGKIVIQKGRGLDTAGAHCIGMNEQSIGICCVGNFDKQHPSDAAYFNCSQLCVNMMEMFPAITPWDIFPHNKFSEKTCPGQLFDMERLKKYVRVTFGEK